MNDIREKDWKIIRSMKDRVLDLACERILEKVSGIIENKDGGSHAKYLELYKALHTEDKQIGIMFNDLRRSSAIQQVSLWKFHGLITDDEIALFCPETQDRIQTLTEMFR